MSIDHIFNRVQEVKTHKFGSITIYEMVFEDRTSIFTPPEYGYVGMKPVIGDSVLVNFDARWVTIFNKNQFFQRSFRWYPTLNDVLELMRDTFSNLPENP